MGHKYKIGDVVRHIEEEIIYEITNLPGFREYSPEYYQGLDHSDGSYGMFKEEEVELVNVVEKPSLRPQDLGCWQQVVDVIGEERAAEELQKVIDIKMAKVQGDLLDAFLWSYTPQGQGFWSDIYEGKSPYTEDTKELSPRPEEEPVVGIRESTEVAVDHIQSLLGTAYADGISVNITHEVFKVHWKGCEFIADNIVSLEKIIEYIDMLEGQLVVGND